MSLYFIRVLWHGYSHQPQAEIASACVLEARDEEAAKRLGWILAHAECESQYAFDLCDVEVEPLDKHVKRYDGLLVDYVDQYAGLLAERTEQLEPNLYVHDVILEEMK